MPGFWSSLNESPGSLVSDYWSWLKESQGPLLPGFWSSLKESGDPLCVVYEIVWQNVKTLFLFLKYFERIFDIPRLIFEVVLKNLGDLFVSSNSPNLGENTQIWQRCPFCLVFEVHNLKHLEEPFSFVFETIWNNVGYALAWFWSRLKESPGPLLSSFRSSLKVTPILFLK